MKQTLMAKAAAIAVLLSGLTFTACSDDEQPGENPETPTVEGTLSPTESKQYIEETATEFLNYFDADDQKPLINLIDHFSNKYGDLDAPSTWEEDDEDSPAFLPKKLTGLGRALKTGNYFAVQKYVTTYNIYFSKYTGIYEPGTNRWVKAAESSDIVFRFPNPSGATAELKLTASGSEYSVDHTEEDEGYSGTYVDEYHVKVPSELHLTLVSGDISMIDATVKSSLSIDNHNFSIDLTATVTNLGFYVKTSGNDSSVTESITLTVGGTRVLSSEGTVSGSHLCDQSFYEELEDDDDVIADMIQSGNAKVDILGRIQVIGSLNNFKKLYNILDDNYYSSYDYSTKAEALAAMEANADLCNSYLPVYLTYTNTGDKQAEMKFKPQLWEGGYGSDYWYYELTPLLVFPDGTSYEFEDYFTEARFGSVTTLFDSIVDKYENIWD